MKARLAYIMISAWAALFCSPPSAAHHELDLLYGHENGFVTIMQPQVHPVRRMVSPQPNNYALDVGVDFFVPDGWMQPMLQRCRMQQVWISPGLVGSKSGVGVVFSAGATRNYFDLPYGGTPHHHFIFASSAPGVYVFDLKATQAVDHLGRPLAEMPFVYRIYMVAGSPMQLYGNVQPSRWYNGSLYDLMLRVRVLQGASEVGRSEQPVNPWAIYPYLVGFNITGNVQVVAKLQKHLSVKIARSLSGSQRVDWSFAVLGDTNEDDRIDETDLAQVTQSFATNHPAADLTGDGQVNLDDLLTVLVHYGQSGEDVR
ncbi:MAG: dockerin type I domain-containing protein [Armatimonadota bacterium]